MDYEALIKELSEKQSEIRKYKTPKNYINNYCKENNICNTVREAVYLITQHGRDYASMISNLITYVLDDEEQYIELNRRIGEIKELLKIN